ncbi:MAG: hypothetical protein ACHP93_00905 [Solirubrobacterales bacterium]
MISVVHLVWAPLGPHPLREFLRSYHSHPPGAEHELAIALNGARSEDGGGSSRDALLAELAGTAHRLIDLERPLIDLAAYGEAAHRVEHPRLCFLNSYSVVLVDGWLGHLSRALDEPSVGLVGATASWESQAEWMRGRAIHWPYQLIRLRAARRDYPRFPNPHIRTNAFMIDRAKIIAMGLEQVRDKRSAYLLESGRVSITRRVQEAGLRAVVAGRDGRTYDVEQWPASRTFRSGDQDNLLIADNQTSDYQTSSPRGRRCLSRDSWGDL